MLKGAQLGTLLSGRAQQLAVFRRNGRFRGRRRRVRQQRKLRPCETQLGGQSAQGGLPSGLQGRQIAFEQRPASAYLQLVGGHGAPAFNELPGPVQQRLQAADARLGRADQVLIRHRLQEIPCRVEHDLLPAAVFQRPRRFDPLPRRGQLELRFAEVPDEPAQIGAAGKEGLVEAEEGRRRSRRISAIEARDGGRSGKVRLREQGRTDGGRGRIPARGFRPGGGQPGRVLQGVADSIAQRHRLLSEEPGGAGGQQDKGASQSADRVQHGLAPIHAVSAAGAWPASLRRICSGNPRSGFRAYSR